jgi:hypothetical protein
VFLERWWDRYTGDLKQAHALFKQTFGFAHDDEQQVDAELARLFRDHSRYGDTPETAVPIPAKLVLALMLRPGFPRGFGHGQVPRDKQARIRAAVLEAHDLLPQYLRRYDYERAKDEAAKEVVRRHREHCPDYDVTVEDIVRKDTWQGRSKRSRARPATT